MNLFDLFEGAIDDLEARRIEDLEAKMDDLTARAREEKDPKVKEALRHQFAKAKAERDSYYKVNVEEADRDVESTIRTLMAPAYEEETGGQFGYMVSIKAPTMDGLRNKYHDDINAMLTQASPKELAQAAQELKAMYGKVSEDLDTNYTYTVYIDGNAIGTYGSKEEAKEIVRKKKEVAPGRDYRIKPKARTSAASIKRFYKNRDRYVDEHGGGVNNAGSYVAWRRKANKERGITKQQPVGKPAIEEWQNSAAGEPEQDDLIKVEGYASTIGPDMAPLAKEKQWKIKVRQLIADYMKNPQGLYNIARQRGPNSPEAFAYNQIIHPTGKLTPPDIITFEGWQDFNKIEPYEVCLAGKPVKQFDYYEDARRFHDNWKKKLYNQGEKEKADKITLNPIMKEAGSPAQQAAIAINMKKHHQKPKHMDEEGRVVSDTPLTAPGNPEAEARQQKQDILKQFAQLGELRTEFIWATEHDVFMNKEQILDYIDQKAYDPDLTALEYMHNNGYSTDGLLKGMLKAATKLGLNKADIFNLFKSARRGNSNPGPGMISRVARSLLRSAISEDAPDQKTWMAQIKTKYPTVKFMQAKMPGAPIRAYVDGKVVAEFKQGVSESKEAVFKDHKIEVEYPEGKGHSHIYHRREPYRLSTIFSDANSVAARNRRATISLFVDGEYIPNYEWQEGVDAPNSGIAEDIGSWIVYDPKTKQIKKRFKTHTAGKSYAQVHNLGFASSEYYFDNVKQAVAENNEYEPSPVASAIVRRIMFNHKDLLQTYGPNLVNAAVDEVADYVGDVDEIGSSDVSAWVAQVERMLKDNPPEAFDEASMKWASNKPTGPKFSGYLKGTDPAPTEYSNKSFGAESKEMDEGISGNLTARSNPLTQPLRKRNYVAKNAQISGAGKHNNNLKAAAARGQVKHKGKAFELDEMTNDEIAKIRADAEANVKSSLDKQSNARVAALKNPPKEKSFMQKVGDKQIGMVKGAWKGLTGQLEESDNFLSWAVRNGYNINKPAIYESAKQAFAEAKINEIKKGQKDSNGYTKCWPGKHAEGTKKGKNGGRVRNCVPNESIEEELDEEFNLIESAINNLATFNNVDPEVIWEDLESLTDDELYVFAVTQPVMEDWQKVNKKDKTDGMSKKAVNAYRREHPGSKLKTAVTTKPSKLKKGSKASKRRKSYCSRSKGQMKMHNISCQKTPDKAICKARRRWNCEGFENLNSMLAEAMAMAESLRPDEYYVWTVYFDDGSEKRIKVKSDEFDPYEYYAKQNKVVVNVDYSWDIHQ